VTAALYELLQMQWRPTASRMAVLIADAPPHVRLARLGVLIFATSDSLPQGIGEYGDGFPNGSPDGHDPLQLTRQMAALGITLVRSTQPIFSGSGSPFVYSSLRPASRRCRVTWSALIFSLFSFHTHTVHLAWHRLLSRAHRDLLGPFIASDYSQPAGPCHCRFCTRADGYVCFISPSTVEDSLTRRY
jgi:hypothetical protein